MEVQFRDLIMFFGGRGDQASRKDMHITATATAFDMTSAAPPTKLVTSNCLLSKLLHRLAYPYISPFRYLASMLQTVGYAEDSEQLERIFSRPASFNP
jgi:hypothetical protein